MNECRLQVGYMHNFLDVYKRQVYYKEGSAETKKQFTKNLHIATKMAAKYGIVMGFETMETPFMDTVEKAMEYVNIVNSPYLQIYPDIGNLTNAEKIYGVSLIDDIQKGKMCIRDRYYIGGSVHKICQIKNI